tara:strand:+ start:1007 stop:1384 length:378 start_codon:yes stop_codon:yes gene_type:complete
MRARDTIIDLAINEASRSDHNVKHGAVVVKKGKIIQSGRNQYCSMDRIKHFTSHRIWSIHAEMNVLMGLPKHITKNADIYVVRVNSVGDIVNSKPCSICMSMILKSGIKTIHYSNDENTIISQKI